MKDPIYKITVEVIGEEEPENALPEQLKAPNGMEARGFVIITTDGEDAHHVSANRISKIDLAMAIAKDELLLPSSVLAKGLYDARELGTEMERRHAMESALDRLKDAFKEMDAVQKAES